MYIVIVNCDFSDLLTNVCLIMPPEDGIDSYAFLALESAAEDKLQCMLLLLRCMYAN